MKNRQLPGLPLQLFLITVLPLTVMLLVIAFGSLGLHQQAMRMMVGERDERATRAAATAISEQINHRLSAIRSVALQASGAAGPDHALSDAAYLLPDFLGGIALYDVAGALAAASSNSPLWTSPKVTTQLQETAAYPQNSDAFILTSITDESRGELWTLVAAKAENFTAVGAFSPSSLARGALSGLLGSSQQATAYVVSAGGEIIYRTGSSPWVETPPHLLPGAAEGLRGESGTSYLTAAGEEYVVSFSPVAPVGWALVMAEPWRAVSDTMLRTTELVPLIFVPVLAIALAALWFGVRRVVQPLQRLEQQATKLGWGEFGAIEEPVGGISEIQRLQAELVHMARKVQRAQQNLRDYLGAVTTGQEEERRRLARELHDETIQSLIALNQQIQLAQMVFTDEGMLSRLAAMQKMAEQIVADLRRLTRDLRPIYLEDLGLIPALEMLVRDMQQVAGIPLHFKTVGEQKRLPPGVELALYRIAQEGLNNVARHALAATATVRLEFTAGQVCLTVQDDGQGFTVPESPAEMAPAGHYGLLGVQERAEAIGARLHISSVPGEGTELVVCLAQS